MDEASKITDESWGFSIPAERVYAKLVTDQVKPMEFVPYDIAAVRKLKAIWTMEAQQDFDAWCSWDMDNIIKDIQQEEDEKFITDLSGVPHRSSRYKEYKRVAGVFLHSTVDRKALIEDEPAKNEVLIQEED